MAVNKKQETRSKELKDMMRFIIDLKIDSFADFIDYCLKYEKNTWFKIATNQNTVAITAVIDSIRAKGEGNIGKKSKQAENKLRRMERVEKAKIMYEKGNSQQEIAEEMGVNKSTISRYLKK